MNYSRSQIQLNCHLHFPMLNSMCHDNKSIAPMPPTVKERTNLSISNIYGLCSYESSTILMMS